MRSLRSDKHREEATAADSLLQMGHSSIAGTSVKERPESLVNLPALTHQQPNLKDQAQGISDVGSKTQKVGRKTKKMKLESKKERREIYLNLFKEKQNNLKAINEDEATDLGEF